MVVVVGEGVGGSHSTLCALNATVGGSLVLSLPFLLSLCSLGLILNFRLGVEPVPQPQPPDITQNRDGRVGGLGEGVGGR